MTFKVPQASNLPPFILLLASIATVLVWVTIAFWGVVFIAQGLFDFTSYFKDDRYYGILYATIGVLFLLQLRTSMHQLRTIGMTVIVKTFLQNRVLEIISTTILMAMIAVIVSMRIDFELNAVLLLPLSLGTSFGYSLGQFLEQTLMIPFAPFFVLSSSWVLQLFWMYMFAWLFVRVLLRFQRINPLD